MLGRGSSFCCQIIVCFHFFSVLKILKVPYYATFVIHLTNVFHVLPFRALLLLYWVKYGAFKLSVIQTAIHSPQYLCFLAATSGLNSILHAWKYFTLVNDCVQLMILWVSWGQIIIPNMFCFVFLHLIRHPHIHDGWPLGYFRLSLFKKKHRVWVYKSHFHWQDGINKVGGQRG